MCCCSDLGVGGSIRASTDREDPKGQFKGTPKGTPRGTPRPQEEPQGTVYGIFSYLIELRKIAFLGLAVLGMAGHVDERAGRFLLQTPSLGRTSLHPIPTGNLLFLGITVQQKRTPARLTLAGRSSKACMHPW